MTSTTRILPRAFRLFAAIPLLILPLLVAHPAAAFYPPDGSKPDGIGGQMNPADGMCVIGVAASGTMLVDWSITNARDCAAWTKAADDSVDLVGLDTQAKCTDADAVGADGYKHAWSTSLCYDTINLRGISRVDLDNTDAMCNAKGGTVVTTGKCVAYGWVYRNRKADGSLPVTGTGIGTTDGIQLTDKVGFCYTSMRETASNADGGSYTSAATCPSYHNSATTAPAEWLPCLSSTSGCQTQASYDAGLGWSYSSSQCVYSYGVKGRVNGTITDVNGGTIPAGTMVDLSGITNQGDCLAAGYSWDAWLPTGPGEAVLEGVGGTYTGIPTANLLYNPNALASVGEGGGDFYTGTGAICLKCHSDQSRSYMERNKPGYVKTRHRNAGSTVNLGKPFQKYFTATNSDWGLDGVQCAMCHSTAKPARDDLIQVNPAGTTNEGLPKSASGHNNTEYGTHLVDICYSCHGTAASPVSVNPASVIPVSGGKFANTAKGLEPIANEFLNSPHAQYTGTSSKVDVGNKAKYGSTFEGYVCRSPAGNLNRSYSTSSACTTAGYTWYTTTNFGGICYYNSSTCGGPLVPLGVWTTVYDTAANAWAADTGGPGGVCYGIGLGSILTTISREGEVQKIPNLDSAVNTACTNPSDGSPLSGAGGFWVKDGEPTGASVASGAPLDTAQGNCMTCHDVHWAIADTEAEAEPFRRECDTCHMNTGSVSDAPQIDLSTINHLAGTGTPLENWQTDPAEACETCHMPPSNGAGSSRMHLWRINTDPNYATMGTTKVNLDADGLGWVDVDHACGQCHGGGTQQDSQHQTTPNAKYRTRAQLAAVANGMHDTAISYPVTFTTKVTGLKVDVVAYVNCGVGITCPSFTFDWDWDDATVHGSGNPSSHLYTAYGARKITLTVKRLGGKIVGTVSRNVTTEGTDLPPVASATCSWNANTWTASVTDTSTDTDPTPVQTATVDWDDASGRGVGGAGATLTHTYLEPGIYGLTFMAIDSALKSASIPLTCTNGPVAPGYFSISGTVLQSDNATVVPNANVVVKLGRVRVVRVQTDSNGEFTASSLRPGTYKIKVKKSGFTFASPAATKTVGPDSNGNTILAVTP